MPDISLFGLGKPGSLLVEKVSNAFGRHFDPGQTVRMAEAEARAYHIMEINRAETDIEVANLRRRAAARLVNEEMSNQFNIENITEKATHYLNEGATPEYIEDDWVRNCIDKSKMVSDESMQDWWARILAGEANNPGSFSRRTVNLVGDLDKRDAELFVTLSRYIWRLNSAPVPLIFEVDHEVYSQNEIGFSSITHLESLGLVHVNGPLGFSRTKLPKHIVMIYGARMVQVNLPNEEENVLKTGVVLLTQSGLELTTICDFGPVDGFFEYVYDKWASESLVPPRTG